MARQLPWGGLCVGVARGGRAISALNNTIRSTLFQAVVGVGGAAVVLLGVVGIVNERPMHQSHALLSIDQPVFLAVSEGPGVIDKLARLRFKYIGLVQTREFSGPVSRALGLPESEVSNALFASGPPDSLLVVVGARHTRAATASSIADATAEHLVEYVQREQRLARVPRGDRVVFTPASPASQPERVDRLDRQLLVVGLGTVLVLGALVLLLVYGRERR